MVEPTSNLCVLRQELELLSGPEAPDKTPTWTIHDPVSGQFFRISWFGFEIVSRWDLADPAAIAHAVTTETTLDATEHDVWELDKVLRSSYLCMPGHGDATHYEQINSARKPSLKKLWETYLFLKIPLFRPDKFLSDIIPLFNWVFTKTFIATATLLTIFSLLLISRHWEEFISTFLYFFRLEGLIIYGVTITLSKVLHELAHALTAKKYGLRVPTLGLALLVFWPLMYTDATESWKLVDKNKRMAIAGAGILAEIVLASIACIFWVFLDDGPLRSACFFLASTNWITTVFFNLNPFMRFDGYFILSDLLNFDNLQQRAFSYTKWKMQEVVFNFGTPPTEIIPRHMRLPLLLYSVATWAYRSLIIVSISLLIYHLFFKLLGIILLVGHIFKVIIFPLTAGIKTLISRRSEMSYSFKGLVIIGLLVAGFMCLFLPLTDSISSQAVLLPQEKMVIHAPESGVLRQAVTQRNVEIMEGSLLFHIESPQLQHALKVNDIKKEKLSGQLSSAGFNEREQDKRLVYIAELDQLKAERIGLNEDMKSLSMKAPITGLLELPEDFYSAGEWVGKNALLATISNLGAFKITTYVSEFQLHRIQVGAPGLFKPSLPGTKPIPVKVLSIHEYALTDLQTPSFASIYEGTLPVTAGSDQALTPMGTYYKVLLVPSISPGGEFPLLQLEGVVEITAAPESLAIKIWNKMAGVIVRESVF